jgi:hypothetical protein
MYIGSQINSSIQRSGKRDSVVRKSSEAQICEEDWPEVISHVHMKKRGMCKIICGASRVLKSRSDSDI